MIFKSIRISAWLFISFALLLVAVLLFQANLASASLPGLGQARAKDQTLKTMRDSPMWRYRDYGYVDCSSGRINGSTWSCRVGMIRGNQCQKGRSRVNTYVSWDGFWGWSTHIRFAPRYRC